MRSATQVTVSTFGVIMGLAGIEHGIGEILQGNVAPEGVMIQSWPDSAFFSSVAGEPAMTIVPNLLVTGILAILVSLIFLVWAIKFVQRKHGGQVMMLLSIIMLLVGGGIFPPIIGLMLGALGTRINAPFTGWRAHLPVGLRLSLGKVWPWLFAACLSAWLCLFPGINVLGYFFGVDDANLTFTVMYTAFGSLLLTILTGFAHDSLQPPLFQSMQSNVLNRAQAQ
jgi:hypothetical protein